MAISLIAYRVRRWLLVLLALLLAPIPQGYAGRLEADQTKHVVLLQTMPVLPVLNHSRAFVDHLARLGYVDGERLALSVLKPDGDRARAVAMLDRALAAGPVDLVVSSATMASQVARERLRGSGIPQLFYTVSDPVGAGLVPAVGEPSGANLTGKVHSVARRTKIEMVLRLLGRPPGEPVRFGFIHSSYPSAVGDARLLAAAAETVEGVEFIPHQVEYHPVPEGLPRMLEAVTAAITQLEGRVDYWWQPSGPLGERPEFARLLRDHSRRAIAYGTNLESVRIGALLHVTPQDEATGREAAQLAVAILEGASPADYPVTPPRGVDLGINLASVIELGLVIPSELVELAGDNLYHERKP